MIQDLAAGRPEILRTEQGRRWSDGLQAGGHEAVLTALNLIETFSQGDMDPELLGMYSPGSPKYDSIWEKVIEAARLRMDLPRQGRPTCTAT